MKIKNEQEALNHIQTYLLFELRNETFAANVNNVINILEIKEITKIPQSPDYLKGVINQQGSVLPVVDLRIKFGMPEVEFSKDTCIIVFQLNIEGEDVTVGAIVDCVKEVLEIEDSTIDPVPSIGTKYRTDFMNGMWNIDERFIMILNIENVFNSDEPMIINELNKNELSEELIN